MNRLGSATSPYLLQHATNPVDWWPWSPDAFAEARRRDVPVLISVGYAACHWCHVMAHESFEDQTVADLVNSTMVAIKVDREERPDVDAVYMTATQAMTGQGGWPMTVFATPDGEPFYCGTYFPRDGFIRLVRAVAQTWADQRDSVLRQGQAVVEAIDRSHPKGFAAVAGSLTPVVLAASAASLQHDYDPVHGGFGDPSGRGPKFPPHMTLLFLLRHYQRTGDERSLEIAQHTCEAMARGGIYDQLAGGFARYAVDNRWIVPHFEKMLYDNALLLRSYTLLWRLTGDALALRVAQETADFLCRHMLTPQGGFASSLDADTDGVEGATYAWTPQQLRDSLGDADGDWAADAFGVTEAGTFEHGTSVLRLVRDLDEADDSVRRRWRDIRQRLAAHRATRPQPDRDDKVVAAWVALAITALVEFASAAWTVDDPADGLAIRADAAAHAATSAANLLADLHLVNGRLRRVSRDGLIGDPAGILEDYGCVAEAFCAMHQLAGGGPWLGLAGHLLDTALTHFTDGSGGFYDTADDAEQLVARPADPTDNATPSGLSSIVAALVTYSALTGEVRYRAAAERALETVVPVIEKHARFAGYASAAAEALISGPYEIAIVTPVDVPAAVPAGPAPSADRAARTSDALVRTARRFAPPGAVIVVGVPDAPGVPLLVGRSMIEATTTAYVCRGFVCDRPVTTAAELTQLLEQR